MLLCFLKDTYNGNLCIVNIKMDGFIFLQMWLEAGIP